MSSVGREHEKKWKEDGTSYECRTEANALKRRCVKFSLCKYWKCDLNCTIIHYRLHRLLIEDHEHIFAR